MRFLALFLFLVMAPFLAGSSTQTDRTEYFRVKVWRLTGTWFHEKHFQKVEVVDTTTRTRTYDASVHASVQFRLVQSKTHSSKRYRWQLEKGFKPIADAHIRISDLLVIKPRNGKPTWSKMEFELDGNSQDGEARLDIEPSDGAYKLVAGFMSTPGTVKATNSEGGSQETESPYSYSSGLLDCEGTASGLNFGSNRTDAIVSASLDNPAGNFLTFHWQLSPWEQEPEGEATFDFVDQDWTPKPDSTCGIEIKWKGKAEKVKVTLSDISREPGKCLNSVETDEDEDLTIESQGKWSAQKEGANRGLKYIAYLVLEKDPPHSVKLDLKARDYGAYGKLQCEVLLDGKWRKATQKASGSATANVPYDLDGNHIADAWEKQEGVVGYAETWDEAEVAGQTAKGDGLTLYSKYRGLRVEGADWIQPTAKEKVHFVIDPSGAFDLERWRASTGIRAYKLTDDMVRGGKVDFNAQTAAGEGKYAVRLELMPGMTEETADEAGNVKTQDSPSQYAYTKGNTPRTTEACRIFPDRIRAMIMRVTTLMRMALTDPVTPAEKEEVTLLAGLGFPMDEIKRNLAGLDKGRREALAQQMIALCAIHEMGHACGVPGHMNGKGEEDQDVQRDQNCPSQYLNQVGRRLFVLFGQLGGGGPFCKAPPDNCWQTVNVKD
jgi:hypothetical protein